MDKLFIPYNGPPAPESLLIHLSVLATLVFLPPLDPEPPPEPEPRS